MTKFEESDMCRGRRYCALCRRAGREGDAFRSSVAGLYDTGGANWKCPHNLPELPNAFTLDELNAFNRHVEELVLEPLRTKDLSGRSAFDRDMVQTLILQQHIVREMLPKEHRVIQALDELVKAEGTSGGCSGCRRKHFLREIAGAIDTCSLEEKEKLRALIVKV
jgi:hypothetical protein